MKKPFATGGFVSPKPLRPIDLPAGEFVVRPATATMMRYDTAEALAIGKIKLNAEPITISVTTRKR